MDTVLFLISALRGVANFQTGGVYLSQILKEKIPIKSLLKLKNYHKMINYELCINDFFILSTGFCMLSFAVITNPVSMGERLQTQSSMDIS